MDDKEIKKALDDFEGDNFIGAKERLSKEIRQSRDEFIKNKLDLKNSIEDKEDEEDKEDKKTRNEMGFKAYLIDQDQYRGRGKQIIDAMLKINNSLNEIDSLIKLNIGSPVEAEDAKINKILFRMKKDFVDLKKLVNKTYGY